MKSTPNPYSAATQFGGVTNWYQSQDIVMLDSKDSTVTYTAISSPFGGLSDIGSPGAPPSPDYVSGLEYPPSPEFIPEPVYLEFMPPKDDVLPAEEQPLPAVVSPTADSPGYVPEDDGDDEDESSNDDDEDDDVDIEGDEEEEEHQAPANSIAIALPTVDHAPSAEETEPFETDESTATPLPHPAYRVTARILIRDEPPTPFWSDTKVARLFSIPTPPPSPLSPWLQSCDDPAESRGPSTSHSPSPHIILSHTRADTPPSGTPLILPIRAPTLSPSLLLRSADHGADRPEVCLPHRKMLCIALGPRYKVGESLFAVAARPTGGFRADYGFVATIDREIRRDPERDVNYGITDTWDEILVDMPGAVITELQAADRKRHGAITELLAADRRRQAQFIEALKLLKGLQIQMTAFQRQQGQAKVHDANRSMNGDDSHVSRTCVRRTERVARECTYPDFMKCQPLNFKGTKGALTWWNSHVRTVGYDVAYAMTWTDLKKKMADKYCPRVEIKKLEAELWNLKSDKIEIYVGGLPDMIHGSVVALKPKTMQEATEIATELMDKKIRTFAERQTQNKRKQDDNHQQP
ncbi:putative reverse transcriptase domain-containing protein [Tanacetum coccineum]